MGASRARRGRRFRRPGNSVERVRRHLARQIIQGGLRPGARLVEQEICRRVGLSRSPVREALRLLAAEGLVELHARRGARVRQISRKEVEDLFQVFEELEVLASRLAASRLTAGAVIRLAALLGRMRQAARRGNVRQYFRLNAALHEIIYRAGGNEKLAQLLLNLGQQVTRLRYLALSTPGRLARSVAEHQALLAALREGDEKAVVELVRVSVANARGAVERQLELPGN